MAPRNPKYDSDHDADRAAWEPVVQAGGVLCRRGRFGCRAANLEISPDEPWELGHPDAACSAPTAPEHRGCNRATKSHQKRLPEPHPALVALLHERDETPGGDPSPHP